MRAELAWREGDPAVVVGCCLEVLAAFDSYRAVWWEPLRARIRGRLALAVLAQGDQARSRDLLDAALDGRRRLDRAPGPGRRPRRVRLLRPAPHRPHPTATRRNADPAITADQAELAARLLGAAHAVRGAFDESSLDAPQARAAARDALGPAAFDAAYRSAADSTYQTALDLARRALEAS